MSVEYLVLLAVEELALAGDAGGFPGSNAKELMARLRARVSPVAVDEDLFAAVWSRLWTGFRTELRVCTSRGGQLSESAVQALGPVEAATEKVRLLASPDAIARACGAARFMNRAPLLADALQHVARAGCEGVSQGDLARLIGKDARFVSKLLECAHGFGAVTKTWAPGRLVIGLSYNCDRQHWALQHTGRSDGTFGVDPETHAKFRLTECMDNLAPLLRHWMDSTQQPLFCGAVAVASRLRFCRLQPNEQQPANQRQMRQTRQMRQSVLRSLRAALASRPQWTTSRGAPTDTFLMRGTQITPRWVLGVSEEVDEEAVLRNAVPRSAPPELGTESHVNTLWGGGRLPMLHVVARSVAENSPQGVARRSTRFIAGESKLLEDLPSHIKVVPSVRPMSMKVRKVTNTIWYLHSDKQTELWKRSHESDAPLAYSACMDEQLWPSRAEKFESANRAVAQEDDVIKVEACKAEVSDGGAGLKRPSPAPFRPKKRPRVAPQRKMLSWWPGVGSGASFQNTPAVEKVRAVPPPQEPARHADVNQVAANMRLNHWGLVHAAVSTEMKNTLAAKRTVDAPAPATATASGAQDGQAQHLDTTKGIQEVYARRIADALAALGLLTFSAVRTRRHVLSVPTTTALIRKVFQLLHDTGRAQFIQRSTDPSDTRWEPACDATEKGPQTTQILLHPSVDPNGELVKDHLLSISRKAPKPGSKAAAKQAAQPSHLHLLDWSSGSDHEEAGEADTTVTADSIRLDLVHMQDLDVVSVENKMLRVSQEAGPLNRSSSLSRALSLLRSFWTYKNGKASSPVVVAMELHKYLWQSALQSRKPPHQFSFRPGDCGGIPLRLFLLSGVSFDVEGMLGQRGIAVADVMDTPVRQLPKSVSSLLVRRYMLTGAVEDSGPNRLRGALGILIALGLLQPRQAQGVDPDPLTTATEDSDAAVALRVARYDYRCLDDSAMACAWVLATDGDVRTVLTDEAAAGFTAASAVSFTEEPARAVEGYWDKLLQIAGGPLADSVRCGAASVLRKMGRPARTLRLTASEKRKVNAMLRRTGQRPAPTDLLDVARAIQARWTRLMRCVFSPDFIPPVANRTAETVPVEPAIPAEETRPERARAFSHRRIRESRADTNRWLLEHGPDVANAMVHVNEKKGAEWLKQRIRAGNLRIPRKHATEGRLGRERDALWRWHEVDEQVRKGFLEAVALRWSYNEKHGLPIADRVKEAATEHLTPNLTAGAKLRLPRTLEQLHKQYDVHTLEDRSREEDVSFRGPVQHATAEVLKSINLVPEVDYDPHVSAAVADNLMGAAQTSEIANMTDRLSVEGPRQTLGRAQGAGRRWAVVGPARECLQRSGLEELISHGCHAADASSQLPELLDGGSLAVAVDAVVAGDSCLHPECLPASTPGLPADATVASIVRAYASQRVRSDDIPNTPGGVSLRPAGCAADASDARRWLGDDAGSIRRDATARALGHRSGDVRRASLQPPPERCPLSSVLDGWSKRDSKAHQEISSVLAAMTSDSGSRWDLPASVREKMDSEPDIAVDFMLTVTNALLERVQGWGVASPEQARAAVAAVLGEASPAAVEAATKLASAAIYAAGLGGEMPGFAPGGHICGQNVVHHCRYPVSSVALARQGTRRKTATKRAADGRRGVDKRLRSDAVPDLRWDEDGPVPAEGRPYSVLLGTGGGQHVQLLRRLKLRMLEYIRERPGCDGGSLVAAFPILSPSGVLDVLEAMRADGMIRSEPSVPGVVQGPPVLGAAASSSILGRIPAAACLGGAALAAELSTRSFWARSGALRRIAADTDAGPAG